MLRGASEFESKLNPVARSKNVKCIRFVTQRSPTSPITNGAHDLLQAVSQEPWDVNLSSHNPPLTATSLGCSLV